MWLFQKIEINFLAIKGVISFSIFKLYNCIYLYNCNLVCMYCIGRTIDRSFITGLLHDINQNRTGSLAISSDLIAGYTCAAHFALISFFKYLNAKRRIYSISEREEDDKGKWIS